jgi:hypothetical protein
MTLIVFPTVFATASFMRHSAEQVFRYATIILVWLGIKLHRDEASVFNTGLAGIVADAERRGERFGAGFAL